MITIESIDDIVVNGGVVETSDGATLGSVEQVFLSEGTGDPAFVTVRTGLFGLSESFVPLAGATIDGSRIRVAFDKSLIKNGPRIESDRGAITTDEENELYRYYGTDTVVETTDVEGGRDATAADSTDETADAAASMTADAVASEISQAASDTTRSVTPPVRAPVRAAVRAPVPPPRPVRAPGPPPPIRAEALAPPPPPPHLLKHVVAGQPHRPPPHAPPPPPQR